MLTQRELTTKVNTMVQQLHELDGEAYTTKKIDMSLSGYLFLNPCFDIEINPCQIKQDAKASVFLWMDGRNVIACEYYRSYEDVSKIIQTWKQELQQFVAVRKLSYFTKPSMTDVMIKRLLDYPMAT